MQFPAEPAGTVVRPARTHARRWLFLGMILLCLSPASRALAQPSQAIIIDGSGPWQDDRWTFTVAQFSTILSDAGYTVSTLAPEDVPAALQSSQGSGPASSNVLLAVPSLQSLPFDTLTAISDFVQAGGSLMASGGEPFQDPLYPTPNGTYLDAAAYQAAVGSPPPQGPVTVPLVPTLSPWYMQYTASSGARVPIVNGRGIIAFGGGRTRVIGDVLSPAATIYSFFEPPQSNNGFNFPGFRNFIVWLSSPELSDPDRTTLVAALHAALTGVHLQFAGPTQIVWLPGETIL
jgi:hypothetical protein